MIAPGVGLAGQPQPGHDLRQRPLDPEPDAQLRAAGGVPRVSCRSAPPLRSPWWEIALPYGDVDVNVHPGKSEVALQARGLRVRGAAAGGPADADGPLAGARARRRDGPRARPRLSRRWSTRSGRSGLAGAPVGGAPEPQPAGRSRRPRGPRLRARPGGALAGALGRTAQPEGAGPGAVDVHRRGGPGRRCTWSTSTPPTNGCCSSASRPRRSRGSPDVQGLMEPVTLAVDHRQTELLETHGDLVRQMGFQVEPFGGGTYILRGRVRARSRGRSGPELPRRSRTSWPRAAASSRGRNARPTRSPATARSGPARR